MVILQSLYDDPAVLRGLAGRLAMRVGGCEERVALSTLQLSLSAQLLTLVLGQGAGELDPATLCWDDDRGSVRLQPVAAVLAVPVGVAGVAELAGRVVVEVLDRNAEPLIAAIRRAAPLAPGLLWGNVASAVLGTAVVLGSRQAREVAAAVLADPRLRGAGQPREGRWRRRSCCLFYRVPGGGVCGDCAFDVAPAARAGAGDHPRRR